MILTILKNAPIVLGVFCLLAAVLLFLPESLKRLNASLSRWISVRKLFKEMEVMRVVDDQILKSSRLLGAVALMVAAVLFYWHLK